jgi:hypothetical protein
MRNASTTTAIRDIQGFEAYVLRNESIELAIVPELGAKVVALKNLRTDREWMASPSPERKLFRNSPGDDFAASTLVGWDECLPTIARCEWQSRLLPDHGEVWSVPWQVEHAAWQRGELTTSVRLAISPLTFQRTIALDAQEILLTYSVTNSGNNLERFLWAMHPLLTIEPGDSLRLPAEVREQLAGETWIDSLDFAGRNPACAKVFTRPRGLASAGVCNATTGDRLTFTWDTEENDTLGLWVTRGGWNNIHHLALEPTNGMPDSLADAVRHNRCATVPAGGTKSWSVRIGISP